MSLHRRGFITRMLVGAGALLQAPRLLQLDGILEMPVPPPPFRTLTTLDLRALTGHVATRISDEIGTVLPVGPAGAMVGDYVQYGTLQLTDQWNAACHLAGNAEANMTWIDGCADSLATRLREARIQVSACLPILPYARHTTCSAASSAANTRRPSSEAWEMVNVTTPAGLTVRGTRSYDIMHAANQYRFDVLGA